MLLAVIDGAGCQNGIYSMDINDEGTALATKLVNALDCLFKTFVKIAADLILMIDLFARTDSKGLKILAELSTVKVSPFVLDNIGKCLIGVAVEFSDHVFIFFL